MTDFYNQYMPVLMDKKWFKENPGFPLSIPLKVLSKDQFRCQKNHNGQALEKVAERGLNVTELYCLMKNIHLKEADSISIDDAVKYIKESFLNNWT